MLAFSHVPAIEMIPPFHEIRSNRRHKGLPCVVACSWGRLWKIGEGRSGSAAGAATI